MALRNEEFHYDPYAEKNPMDKVESAKRLMTIKLSSELSARVTEAAARQKLSVDQYLEDLLGEVLPEQSATQHTRKPISQEGVEKLKQFRDQLLQEHGGKPFEDSVNLLREAREERDKELGS